MTPAVSVVQLKRDRQLAVVGLVVLLVPTLWYVRTDLALYAGSWSQLGARFFVRAVFIAVLVGGVWGLARAGDRARYEFRLFMVAMGITAALAALNYLRPSGSSLPLRSPLVVLAAMYAAFPNRFGRQILPPLLLTGALLLLRATKLTGVAGGDLGGDVVALLGINVVGLLMIQGRLRLEAEVGRWVDAVHSSRETAERNLAELRTLQGVIPICAHCHEVRSAVGDWQDLEAYLAEHSAADFAQGVCPDCLSGRSKG